MNSMDDSPRGKPPVTTVLPDDHSKLVPLLPIPTRTVKRLSADDSADSRVKVGHRQALIMACDQLKISWAFCFCEDVFYGLCSYEECKP